MKDKDLTEQEGDRQLFIMFPSEVDDLLTLTEKRGFDDSTAKFALFMYLFLRRKGVAHGEAISQSEIQGYHHQI